MQKFTRAVVGTNNMDNCSRYCQARRPQDSFVRSAMGVILVRSAISKTPTSS